MERRHTDSPCTGLGVSRLRTLALGVAVLSALALGAVARAAGSESAEARLIGFEERLDCQRALEKVAWRHRTWPAGNPGPKPAFDELMPEEALRRAVLDTGRLSGALEAFWQQPITADDLQAEVDRMARDTTWPSVLEELFDALGRDPALVAECLARPQLAQLRARELYAFDDRVHGDLERRVRRELAEVGAVDDLFTLSGEYSEREWVRYGVTKSRRAVMAEEGAAAKLILDPPDWQRLVADLEEDLGGASLGEVSSLNETAEAFSVTALLSRSDDRLRVATVVWPKRSFDSWWAENGARFEAGGSPVEGIHLPQIEGKAARGNTWTDTEDLGAPSKRTHHTATWTGWTMCVWGGANSQSVMYNGYRYFPATDAWVPMTSTDHPDGRAYHSAVWTGTDVVIWGGWYGGYRGDGGVYHAATNVWLPMTTTSAPTARREHSATWDGSYMVIFGGWDGTYKGVGGRWNIDTDWSSMSSTNAPSARIGHAAVYCEDTSGPVVVWGGENAGGVLGTGAEYNSSTNIWSTMPTGLTARTGHSGVYMGSAYPGSAYDGQRRVIFWGGNTGSSTTTTGSAYDPITNQWEAIQTTTIESRQGHTAIASDWTMIVWGGFSGSTLYKTGGIYNPVNDDWESTFTLGAPTARDGHTAIWVPQSGTFDQAGQMIVWGGEDADDYCDTGGLYSPVSDILMGANTQEFETVPGGSEYAAVTAHIYSLSGFTGPVTLSCEPSYYVTCTFEENPVTMTANGVEFIDVNFFPPPSALLADYPFQISVTTDEARSYPMKMKVRDFDVTCSPSTVEVPAGGSVQVQCSVESDRGFNDLVTLQCDDPYADCSFAPSSVTPPPDGTAQSTLTLEPVFSSGSYSQTVRARSHDANRYFDIDFTVTSGLIFADGFESGSTSGW